MNNNHLVLLTNMFPYGKTESFIEKELVYLSKDFSRVTVISNVNESDTKRALPNNCVVLNYKSKQSIGTKIVLLFRMLLNLRMFIFLKDAKIEKGLNIKKIILATNTLFKAFGLFFFIQDKKLKPNLIYSYWLDHKSIAIGLYRQKFSNTIGVSRAHGGDLYRERTALNYIPFHTVKAKLLNKIFFISQNGYNYFSELNNGDESKLCLSRLGVALPNKIPNKTTKVEKLVLSCSFISSVKRIERIVDALALVRDIQIRWVHIGNGPRQTEIERHAKQKLVNSNITYQFKGALTSREILTFYEEHYVDVFVNVSESEGIPVSIMEAMAFKTPIIATNVGGTSELVNTSNGILLNSNFREDELAISFVKILGMNKIDIEAIRNNSQNTIKEFFNVNINYKKFTQQLINLCNEI